MALWFSETASSGHRLEWKVRRVLYTGRSRFQDIAVLETEAFGPTLVLDGILQTTAGDEFIYHEMMALVPLSAHPAPERVLIIGGGDGGLAREVLRCPWVQRVTLVEIDPEVVEVSKRYLPGHAVSFADPRLEVLFRDGAQFVEQLDPQDRYDVILVDSTDPEGEGPGRLLYAPPFRRAVARALAEGGIFVQQTGTPFYNPETVRDVAEDSLAVFPLAKVYWCIVPTYPGGLFTFIAASKGPDPAVPRRTVDWPTRWYNATVHRASFALPPLLAELLPPAMRAGAAGL
ncbi:MAG: polyamine aminopropyltransferase [Firmicutes bacterium]|nr:polyamine aminopropyltransferase [Alicyclobacillaceae bacterium]MCL6497809.1 polyamine aminopropyltransferase [Bacillota bacterium]